MAESDRFKEDLRIDVMLRGRPMLFATTWGLFSPRKIDDGTYRLIEAIEVGADDVSLDLGCGYGAIGLAIARDSPRGLVHLVDKDFVALDYARRNAQLNALENVKIYPSNALSAVESDVKFNTIAANLPANVGKQLLSTILLDSKDHLTEGGRLWVVTIAGLRKFIRRNFEEVFGNYTKVKQGKTYTVALARRT
jgi:16S rRNA G1207 methylase RsmC